MVELKASNGLIFDSDLRFKALTDASVNFTLPSKEMWLCESQDCYPESFLGSYLGSILPEIR